MRGCALPQLGMGGIRVHCRAVWSLGPVPAKLDQGVTPGSRATRLRAPDDPTWPSVDTDGGGGLDPAQLVVAHDAETDLQLHLKLADLPFMQEPPHLSDLEPIQALE